MFILAERNEKMNDKEKNAKDRCKAIRRSVDQTTAETMIKEEFKGCAVQVCMDYGSGGQKMFMGMMMWEDIDINF